MKAFNLAGIIGALVSMTASPTSQKGSEELQTPIDNKGFAVVELFTSEGCSSCPPAEELVEKIQGTAKDKPIYILVYHVDYWDHQGWKDRFSDREFSNRQRQYSNWLHLRGLYTPQIVVNGTSEHIGSHQGSVLDAISTGLRKETPNTLALNSKLQGETVTVQYHGAGNEKNTELVLALIQKSAQTKVMAGENTGKNLSHVQIVRKLQRHPINTSGKGEAIIVLPKDLNNQHWEVLGMIQSKSNGKISGAAKTALNSAVDAKN